MIPQWYITHPFNENDFVETMYTTWQHAYIYIYICITAVVLNLCWRRSWSTDEDFSWFGKANGGRSRSGGKADGAVTAGAQKLKHWTVRVAAGSLANVRQVCSCVNQHHVHIKLHAAIPWSYIQTALLHVDFIKLEKETRIKGIYIISHATCHATLWQEK